MYCCLSHLPFDHIFTYFHSLFLVLNLDAVIIFGTYGVSFLLPVYIIYTHTLTTTGILYEHCTPTHKLCVVPKIYLS